MRETLYLYYEPDGKDFYMYAEDNNTEREKTLPGKLKEVTTKFRVLYDLIENQTENKTEEARQIIKDLSAILLAPFSDMLDKAGQVRFIIDTDLVRCAFDLLEHKGKPLYLQYPVSYMVDDNDVEEVPRIKLNNALMVADLTSDPEQACREVSKLVPNSRYYEIGKASNAMIQKASYDLLLISAHGSIEDDTSGEMEINDEALTSDELENVEATLIYFDSCQQGANTDFIETFQEEGICDYYAAPLTSNEAGDSSTKTMVWFFTELLSSGDPAMSLFKTRQKLYEHYSKDKSIGLGELLYKAFVFRLYEFT